MTPLTHADIIRLRLELKKAEQLYQSHAHLASQREECEKMIGRLQEEVEIDPYHLPEQDSLPEPHKQPLRQQQLQELKRKKQEIDLLLDESEDLSEEELRLKQQALLTCIWTVYPSYQQEWENRWKDYQISLTLEEQFLDLKQFTKDLSNHLHYAIQHRQTIKGIGILNYILGTSPNLVIEKQLLTCHQAIQRFLPRLQTLSQQTAGMHHQIVLKDFLPFLEQLKKQCQTPWSFKHLDTVFTDAHKQLVHFHQIIEQDLSQLQRRSNELKQQLNDWLQQI
ncbi:conserved hypothetical protein [Candidatus Protochlamydia naegleriophila]|uniref:Uncharacterized protein n=1 Tax=Candidatus Protochlamydia naegleriophila TaxID=389348 RepID=A0A0U5EQI3_9BACT|nr:hypothetical protein [Candidatus Protochlamydia naegleriophila]CUI16400.1 conserved hypothetical protein [Candidatus Protochlamydia naegleriophila]